MNKPLFSVIVPIYNIEKYLDKCVQSLLAQTHEDFELVLVDDGSKDGSPQICDRYAAADDRIKVVHKKNGGPVSARKAGAEVSAGRYIVCVDGDDWLSENCLERYAEIIEKHNPQIVCCNFFQGTEEEFVEKKLHTEDRFYDRDDIEKELFPYLLYTEEGKGISTNIWGKAFERELYLEEQLSVPDEIVLGEDMAVVKPCVFKAESIYTTVDSLCYYRYNPSSITKGKKAFAWNGPYLRARHMESRIDMAQRDFEQQLCSLVCHMLFNVASSQFCRKEKYSVISKEIKEKISDEYFVKCINSCRFKKADRKFMRFALKYRLTVLLWLYNKAKNR